MKNLIAANLAAKYVEASKEFDALDNEVLARVLAGGADWTPEEDARAYRLQNQMEDLVMKAEAEGVSAQFERELHRLGR